MKGTRPGWQIHVSAPPTEGPDQPGTSCTSYPAWASIARGLWYACHTLRLLGTGKGREAVPQGPVAPVQG